MTTHTVKLTTAELRMLRDALTAYAADRCERIALAASIDAAALAADQARAALALRRELAS